MSDHDNIFHYESLDSKTSFRLLELLPGDNEAPTRCMITHHNIQKCPPYRAVSYRWGGIGDIHLITVNGSSFPIRHNLWHLFQQIRSPSEPLLLWIDAICIDQRSAHEKTTQIRLMGSIYRNAESTIVWLGVAADDSDLAMTSLQQAHNADTSVWMWSAREWRALCKLFEREYWSRIWVIQEVVLARKVVLYCGNRQLAWLFFNAR
jgi:hypothetical protein